MFIILNWVFDLWMGDNFVTTCNVKLKRLLCDCWLLRVHIGFKADTYRKNCGQQQFQMNSCVSMFFTTVFPRSWRPLLIVSVITSVPRRKCSCRLLQRQQNFETWTKGSHLFTKNNLLKPEKWQHETEYSISSTICQASMILKYTVIYRMKGLYVGTVHWRYTGGEIKHKSLEWNKLMRLYLLINVER